MMTDMWSDGLETRASNKHGGVTCQVTASLCSVAESPPGASELTQELSGWLGDIECILLTEISVSLHPSFPNAKLLLLLNQ